MNLSELQKPLRVDQIEFRLQSINKGGYATILAYKDARADMQRLDEVFTPLGWKREHLRDNKNCIVSVYDHDNKQWVSKEDTGTESNAEAEKGLASDSFKRACFNWGIGRELYDYPVISIKLNDNEWRLNDKNKNRYGEPTPTPTWDFKLKEWLWYSEFDDSNKISFLAARDANSVRFKWGKKREDNK